ncbi:hypothetical protein [Vibrio crassostreae]|uniref:hypothetical protein n=1 Tax=Vibrio crassostreae TaxID=246167 RepID=UPI001B304F1E|nr:hypothetical protein [Vibrio crassostreae]
MSYDAIIEFKSKDDSLTAAIYLPFDGHPDDVIPLLIGEMLSHDRGAEMHGRISWGMMTTNLIGKLISTHPKCRLLPNPSESIPYLSFRITISETDQYSNTRLMITNAINVAAKYENLQDFIYEGSVGHYKRQLTPDELSFKALIRDIDMFFVVQNKEGEYFIELASPDVVEMAYYSAPVVYLNNVHDVRVSADALEYFCKTGTGILVTGGKHESELTLDLSKFVKDEDGSISHPNLEHTSRI